MVISMKIVVKLKQKKFLSFLSCYLLRRDYEYKKKKSFKVVQTLSILL